METSKNINFEGRPKSDSEIGGNNPGCAFWFFGNENSADNDLKKNFEISDEKDNGNK